MVAKTTSSGGLYHIDAGTVASGQPLSSTTLAMMAHNADLLACVQDRQLANDHYPRVSLDGDNSAVFLCTDSGTLIAMWGPFSKRPNVDIRGKMRAHSYTNTYSTLSNVFLVSTPTTPRRLFAREEFDRLLTATSGLPQSSGTQLASKWDWYDFSLSPDYAQSNQHYLALYAEPISTVSGEVRISNVSLWERSL